jgi:hypothetical protein
VECSRSPIYRPRHLAFLKGPSTKIPYYSITAFRFTVALDKPLQIAMKQQWRSIGVWFHIISCGLCCTAKYFPAFQCYINVFIVFFRMGGSDIFWQRARTFIVGLVCLTVWIIVWFVFNYIIYKCGCGPLNRTWQSASWHPCYWSCHFCPFMVNEFDFPPLEMNLFFYIITEDQQPQTTTSQGH